jgi:hypothetical protein
MFTLFSKTKKRTITGYYKSPPPKPSKTKLKPYRLIEDYKQSNPLTPTLSSSCASIFNKLDEIEKSNKLDEQEYTQYNPTNLSNS